MPLFRKLCDLSLDPSLRSVHQAVASVVRSASVAAFAAEVSAVAATSGATSWAAWRRLGLGWRFWMGLGSSSAYLASACLLACLPLAVSHRSFREEKLRGTSWCAWLNIATIALLYFVPAIAAL